MSAISCNICGAAANFFTLNYLNLHSTRGAKENCPIWSHFQLLLLISVEIYELKCQKKVTFPSPVPFNLLSSFFQNEAPLMMLRSRGRCWKTQNIGPWALVFKPTYKLLILKATNVACKTVENFAPFDFSFCSCCRNDDLSCGDAGSCSGQFQFCNAASIWAFLRRCASI